MTVEALYLFLTSNVPIAIGIEAKTISLKVLTKHCKVFENKIIDPVNVN